MWVALTFTTTTSLTRDEIAAFTTNGTHVEKYSGSSPEVSGVLFACSGGEVQW